VDIILLIISLSISTYIVSSIYYRFRKQEILPNLIVLCYLWLVIGVVVAYIFYFEKLNRMLNGPGWLGVFFSGILGVAVISFGMFLKVNGVSRKTVLKAIFLTGCVFGILFSVYKGYLPIVYAMYFNIAIYLASTILLFIKRDSRQSNLSFAQIFVGILALSFCYTYQNQFAESYTIAISNGAIFLIAVGSLLYYLEYTTLSLSDVHKTMIEERDQSEAYRQKYEMALNVTQEGIWEYDLRNDQSFLSSSLQHFFGVDSAIMEDSYQHLLKQLHPDDRESFVQRIGGTDYDALKNYLSGARSVMEQQEFRMFNAAAERYYWVNVKTRKVVDDESGAVKLYGSAAVVQDVKDAEEKIYNLAYYDQLTGLPNATSFYEFLRNLRMQKSHANILLFLIDLDRFKYINDSRGHSFGDSVIRTIVLKLNPLKELGCNLFRFGGTEFVITGEADDYENIKQHLLQCFNRPLEIQEANIHLTASVGYCTFDISSCEIETIMIQLDLAKNKAKERGGNCMVPYSDEFQREIQNKVSTSDALRLAIVNRDIFMHYQPKVDMQSREIVGYEALVRWKKDGEFVPPDLLVAIAEETGQIYSLGLLIIEMVFAEAGFVNENQSIAINLSALQLEQIEFVEDIRRIQQKFGINPQRFIFEITEGVLLQDFDSTVQILDQLKVLGYRISLDDFGSGYASYNYLAKLPLDELKLDRSLTHSVLESDRNAALVRHMIMIGKLLGFIIVCEGVESREEYGILQSLGSDLGQGYFFSKPYASSHFLD